MREFNIKDIEISNKAIKVIKSCQNTTQFYHALKYVQLAKKTLSESYYRRVSSAAHSKAASF